MNEQKNNQSASFFSSSRRTKKKLLSTAMALLLAILLIGINLLATLLPWKARAFNLDTDSIFGLSSYTKTTLKELNEDISIYFICEDGSLNADPNILSFLKNYETLSSHVSVKILNTKTNLDFLAERQLGELSGDLFILVESARRHTIIPVSDLYYYYCADLGTTYPSYEYTAETAAQLTQMGLAAVPYFNGEDCVTNAISYVTREDVPVIAVMYAALQAEDGSVSMLNAAVHSSLLRRLMNNGCDLRYITSVAQLTSEHEALIFNTPYIDISEGEADHLSAWLAAGGDMLLTTTYLYYNDKISLHPNLESVLKEYGLYADDKGNRIVETNKANLPLETASATYIAPNIPKKHVMIDRFTGYLTIGDAHALFFSPLDDVTVTPFLTSSSEAYRETYDINTGKTEIVDQEKTSFNYGLIAEKNDTRIVWVSTPLLFDFDYNTYSFNGNYDLTLYTLQWLTENKGPIQSITFEANAMTASTLLVTTGAFAFWSVVLVAIIPISIFTLGCVRVYTRKKK